MNSEEDHATETTPPHTTPFLGVGGRALVTAAAAFALLFALKYTREFMMPIITAAFLAIVSYPFADVLRRRLRFPNWLAVTFSVLLDCGFIFLIYRLIKYLTTDLVTTLKSNVVRQLEERYTDFLNNLDQWGVGDHVRDFVSSTGDLLDTQAIISLSQSLTGRIFSFMSVTLLVLILMTFMLIEAPLFIRNFNKLPNSMQGKKKMLNALKGVQKYLFIKTIASVCTGLLAWWLCHAMGIPFSFLWGFVACLLNFIPTIGSIVAAIPPILLTIALRDWSVVFIVSGGYLAINFAIGNGIEPVFQGKQFGISTTVVIISVIIWGWVWGPLGMLMAVPITVLLKLALENSEDLSWLASIIDDNHLPKTKNTNT